jgi:toxin ParE1/3/4
VPEKLHKSSRFLRDYAHIVRTIAAADPLAADRFCDAVEHALKLLASHPLIGVKAGFRHAPSVRKWVIRPYANYLLFYDPRPDKVLVIRLLHAARDLPPLIPEE